jgi:outer membrane protein assembly factor BamB
LSGVYAFDEGTGALRWKWEFEDKRDAFPCENLTADGSFAFAWMMDKRQSLFGRGTLIALDAGSGQEKWRHATSGYANLAGEPLLQDGNTVLIADYPAGKDSTAEEAGFVYRALDRASGGKIWESQTNWKYQDGVSIGGLLFVSDRKVHAVLNENNDTSPDSWISAVNLRSGKEIWRSETIELGIFTTPAAGGGIVLAGSKPFTRNDPAIKGGKNEVAGLWAWRASP